MVAGGGYYAAKDVNFKTLESFRFEDDYWVRDFLDTKYSVVRVREPTSFGRENVTAIVILSRCGGNKESNVKSFIILLSVEGLASFSINNRTNFLGEKKLK